MTKKQSKPKEQSKPKVAKKRSANPKGDGGDRTPKADSTNVVPIRGDLPVEVLGADETYANSVHLKIMDLMQRYEETYFALARSLYEVKSKKLYRSLDGNYETFQDYVENAIGIDYRKSKYLTRMWWWYGIEQNANLELLEGAQEIGWSKAKELIEVIDGRNAKRWFKLAKGMNVVDLRRAATVAKKAAEEKRKKKAKGKAKSREEKARAGSGEGADEHPEAMKVLDPKSPAQAMQPEASDGFDGEDATDGIDPPDNVEAEVEAKKEKSKEWQRWKLDVHKDNWQSVKDALRFAGELAGSKHEGHLFSLICLHYNSFYDGQKSVVIGEWLAQLERLTGLSLVAIDRRTDEIVYGVDLIDELAKMGVDDALESGVGDQGDEGDGGDSSPVD